MVIKGKQEIDIIIPEKSQQKQLMINAALGRPSVYIYSTFKCLI